MVKRKIEISLTDFIDFVSKSGGSKMTKVKQIKKRDAYQPFADFYKGLREGIIETHEKGLPKKELNKIIDELTDPKKISNYKEAIEGYKKFLQALIWQRDEKF